MFIIIYNCLYVSALLSLWLTSSLGFSIPGRPRRLCSALRASKISEERRKELMSRDALYFNIDQWKTSIEFGASIDLVTNLEDTGDREAIEEWLRDGRTLALSIWDDIEELSENLYKLRIMKLQFVTLQLQPTVDVQMETVTARSVKDPQREFPLFRLQSVDFDPHLEVLPGMKIAAETLGIVIHVVGDLRPTTNGKGVTGKVSFATTGNLPPALAILPQGVLRAAANSINKTIISFASRSFENGARTRYEQFRANKKAMNDTAAKSTL